MLCGFPPIRWFPPPSPPPNIHIRIDSPATVLCSLDRRHWLRFGVDPWARTHCPLFPWDRLNAEYQLTMLYMLWYVIKLRLFHSLSKNKEKIKRQSTNQEYARNQEPNARNTQLEDETETQTQEQNYLQSERGRQRHKNTRGDLLIEHRQGLNRDDVKRVIHTYLQWTVWVIVNRYKVSIPDLCKLCSWGYRI